MAVIRIPSMCLWANGFGTAACFGIEHLILIALRFFADAGPVRVRPNAIISTISRRHLPQWISLAEALVIVAFDANKTLRAGL